MSSSSEMTTHLASTQNGVAEPTAHEIAVAEVNAIVHAVKVAVGVPTQMAAENASLVAAKSGAPQSSQVATEGPTPETTPETTPPLCKKAVLPNPQTGAGNARKSEKQRAKRRRQRVKKAKKLARIEAAYSRAPSCEPNTTLDTVREKAPKEKAPKEKAVSKSLETTKVPTQKRQTVSKLAKPEIEVQDQAEEMFDFEVNQKDIPFIDDWEKFVDDEEDTPSTHHSKEGPACEKDIPICLSPKEKTSESFTDLAAVALKEKEVTPSLEREETTSSSPIELPGAPLMEQEVTPTLEQEKSTTTSPIELLGAPWLREDDELSIDLEAEPASTLEQEKSTSTSPIELLGAPWLREDDELRIDLEAEPECEDDAFASLAISLPSTRIDVDSLSLDLLLPEARWKDAEEELSADDEVVEAEDQAKETSASLGGRNNGPGRTDGPNGSDGSDGSDETDGSFHESHNSPDPEPPKKKVRFTFAGLSPFSPREPRKLRRRKKSPSTARLLARGVKMLAHKIKNKVRRFARAVWKLGGEDTEETLDKEPSRLRKWKTILSLLVSK